MDDHVTRPLDESDSTGPHDASTPGDPGTWRLPSHTVRFCKLESCQPDGARELAQLLEERLGVKVDERAYDGTISLESIECIGLCDIPQAALIDDAPVMGLRSVMRTVDALLDED